MTVGLSPKNHCIDDVNHLYGFFYIIFTSIISQTSFSHISINSLMILIVSMATESPQRDLLIDASHISRQSILAKILSRSTGSYCLLNY